MSITVFNITTEGLNVRILALHTALVAGILARSQWLRCERGVGRRALGEKGISRGGLGGLDWA